MRKAVLVVGFCSVLAACGGSRSSAGKSTASARASAALVCFGRLTDSTWLVSASQTDQSGATSDRLVAVEFTRRQGTAVVDVSVRYEDDSAGVTRLERQSRAELRRIHTPPRLMSRLLVRRGNALAVWDGVPTRDLSRLLGRCLKS